MYSFNEHYFDAIDTPDKAYWLGVLWADGCIAKNKKVYSRIRLAAAEHNLSLLQSFAKALETTKPITISVTASKKGGEKKYSRAELCISSKHMAACLMKHGIVPRKSSCDSFPTFPVEFTSHFVRGLFDGDGCVWFQKQTNLTVDITGSKATCEWLLNNLPNFLGFSGHVYSKPNSDITFRWNLFSYSEVVKFRNWIYADTNIYFKPKFDKFYKTHILTQ